MELLNQRLADAVEKLKYAQSQKAEAADVGGDNWHDNFAFEDLLRQEMMHNKQIADIRAIQNQLILVEYPRDIDTVQIGHIITVEDEEASVKDFRVGGYGETNLQSTPPTLEYGAPVISPFMGMSVGAEADVQIRGKITSLLLTQIRMEE
jgi:hypothetical protein